jgi:hypothetical protein
MTRATNTKTFLALLAVHSCTPSNIRRTPDFRKCKFRRNCILQFRKYCTFYIILKQKFTGLTAGFQFPVEPWVFFFLFHIVQTGSVVHRVSYPMDAEDFISGAKELGRQAGHSPPSSVEVK